MVADEREEEREHGRILRAIVRRYEWILGHALDNRAIVLIVMVLVLFGSFLLYRSLGSEFLPEFDESAFVLDYKAPPGASLAETDRMLGHVEEMLMKTPEVESYSRRTGLELGLFITEPNTGDFAVKLKPGHARATMRSRGIQRESSLSRLEIGSWNPAGARCSDLTSLGPLDQTPGWDSGVWAAAPAEALALGSDLRRGDNFQRVCRWTS
jgi:multidrug efflux pump subunit AcrB